ncbi:16S rRNA (guanine(527)-N(7))-methyltransferase RsmG [Candidatus Parabeggiatoa sp. HSG14]|uniref:16S rRNA (guanine(527)-N(7))-methyltransferase RsmG n=1 Tax=Candidatus Parabeggiatoa sp. HSG14 TaxID=3055593 RepID=UPI0025A70898|nr:16S rRNA (guanine(527)-N(7))-methyltransferase RsmG [Thiotrichales bacterium HSG14]
MIFANNLQQGLHALELDFSVSTQKQILDYLHLLEKWNRVYNLTAVRDITQMISKHVLDSLAVLPYIHGTQILDVGTGAGLPGLLLAMTHPDWQCVLLDSNAKKTRFIRQAVIELGIKNVEIVCTRIEAFNPILEESGEDKKFSTIISRAYASLSHFYQQTARLCAVNGCLLAMKGIYPKDEIAELTDLPLTIESFPLKVPQLEAQRHLIVMRS